MPTTHHDLYSDFFHHFSVNLVTSPEQDSLVAQLRHRVFSEECGFEPVSKDGHERDSYDRHSVQCLIRHRSSGLPASCIRLIFAGKRQHMALEDLCPDHVHMQFREKIADQRSNVCEVSRFAVHPVFRRTALNGRRTPPKPVLENVSHRERRSFSMLSSVALMSACAMATLHDREWLFSLMELQTPRLVRRTAGVNVRLAGESIEHFGRIAPFCVSTTDAIENLRSDMLPVYEAIRSMLAQDLGRGLAAPNVQAIA